MPSDKNLEIPASDVFDELTSAEMEQLEELVGEPLGSIFGAFETNSWGVRHIKTMAYVTAKRKDPDLEWDGFTFTAAEFGNLFDPPA